MMMIHAWKPRREGCGCSVLLRGAICSAGLILGAAAGAADTEQPAATTISPPLAAGGGESTPRESDKVKTESAVDLDRPKNYAIPALEILSFDFLLNQYNRHHFGSPYHSNLSSINRNLHHGWVIDNDPFSTNQFWHPYQGSIYHGFARSAGLDYWESFAYTFAGSAFWEIAGETTPPSRNDQIATGIAGTFLGESLFRMANLLLEQGGGVPPLWRELGAAAISPSMGFNRMVFGDRYATSFASHEPAYYGRLQLGVSGTTQNVQGTSTKLKRNEALADFSLDYGLPGKPGYTYTRPFDYFSFQSTASSANGVENIMTRGLLLGTDYAAGESYRGLWGIYGSYDYIAPQTFRVSSTALSLGTTGQWWLSDTVALQGSALAGAGYAAVSTLHGAQEGD